MNDYALTMVRMRAEQLMREARQDRLAAAARRGARARHTASATLAARGSAQWLAMAAARMRPTVTGR